MAGINLDICELIDKCKTKDEFDDVIYTIVMDSIEDEYGDEYDDEDEEPIEPKTDQEVLDLMNDKANDALVIMADPLYEFLFELSELYYFQLKKETIEKEAIEKEVIEKEDE